MATLFQRRVPVTEELLEVMRTQTHSCATHTLENSFRLVFVQWCLKWYSYVLNHATEKKENRATRKGAGETPRKNALSPGVVVASLGASVDGTVLSFAGVGSAV